MSALLTQCCPHRSYRWWHWIGGFPCHRSRSHIPARPVVAPFHCHRLAQHSGAAVRANLEDDGCLCTDQLLQAGASSTVEARVILNITLCPSLSASPLPLYLPGLRSLRSLVLCICLRFALCFPSSSAFALGWYFKLAAEVSV